MKLVRFSTSKDPANPIEANVSGMQSELILRCLIGVLAEACVGFVRATAGRLRWAQQAQTQAAIRPRGRSTRPTRRSAFVCKPGG